MNRIAVRGIIFKENKLLCVRQKHYSPALKEHGADYWCLPGGGIEDGESLAEALVREMVEETGVKPLVGNLLYVQQFKRGNNYHLEFFFHITNTNEYSDIDLSKTTHGEEEIEELGFVDPKNTHILPVFLTSEPLDEFITSNAPTRIFNQINK